jgi:hypothetical protein
MTRPREELCDLRLMTIPYLTIQHGIRDAPDHFTSSAACQPPRASPQRRRWPSAAVLQTAPCDAAALPESPHWRAQQTTGPACASEGHTPGSQTKTSLHRHMRAPSAWSPSPHAPHPPATSGTVINKASAGQRLHKLIRGAINTPLPRPSPGPPTPPAFQPSPAAARPHCRPGASGWRPAPPVRKDTNNMFQPRGRAAVASFDSPQLTSWASLPATVSDRRWTRAASFSACERMAPCSTRRAATCACVSPCSWSSWVATRWMTSFRACRTLLRLASTLLSTLESM